MSGVTSNAAPRVSLIIAAYNATPTLPAAIESALAQTYRSLEILVVDDGSTDDTQAVLRAFGERIRVVSIPHGGVAAARNAGVRAARGEYVCYLDADDTLAPDRVERQVAYFETLPPHVGLVFTNAVVSRKGDHAAQWPAYQQPPSLESAYERLLLGTFIFAATAMLRRSCFDEVGWYDETLETGEDYDLFLRLARGYEIRYLDAPLYHCTVHDTSLMRRTSPRQQQRTLLRILEKQFADPSFPPALHHLRARAIGNVYREVARQHLERGERLPAAQALAVGILADPRAVLNTARLRRFLHAALRRRGRADRS